MDVQFNDEEDAELAAQLAIPAYKRTWLLKISISLAISAAILIAGITVRVIAPQTVRSLIAPCSSGLTNPIPVYVRRDGFFHDLGAHFQHMYACLR